MSYEHGNLLMRIANRYDEPLTKPLSRKSAFTSDLLYAANQLEMPKGHGEQEFHQTQEISSSLLRGI